LVFCVVFLLQPAAWRVTTRLIDAWDLAIGLYLFLALSLAMHFNFEQIKRRAETLDESRWLVLSANIVSTAASLAAIVAELAAAKAQHGSPHWQLVGLSALTILLSWSFLHTAFAFHYAHEYYGNGGDRTLGGLEFPQEKQPDYWDFIYFSFIIGTAAQTADVNIASRAIRKVATLHCILSFFFNTVILGLTVNISASLF
jgi:uncharacterized membrane protein